MEFSEHVSLTQILFESFVSTNQLGFSLSYCGQSFTHSFIRILKIAYQFITVGYWQAAEPPLRYGLCIGEARPTAVVDFFVISYFLSIG